MRACLSLSSFVWVLCYSFGLSLQLQNSGKQWSGSCFEAKRQQLKHAPFFVSFDSEEPSANPWVQLMDKLIRCHGDGEHVIEMVKQLSSTTSLTVEVWNWTQYNSTKPPEYVLIHLLLDVMVLFCL